MDYEKACCILEIQPPLSSELIKKKYRIQALKYHPDKHMHNKQYYEDKFKQIYDAYDYLINFEKKQNDYMDFTAFFEEEKDSSETNQEYNTIFKSFLNSSFSHLSQSTDIIETIIRVAKMTIHPLSDKIFQHLNTEQLTQIYEFILQYESILYIDASTLKKIKSLLKQKIEDCSIILLHPSIDDLLLSNVYVLHHNDEIFYVPLWHGELHFETKSGKDLIVKCVPELDKHLYLEDNNDLYVNITTTFTNLIKKKVLHIDLGSSSFHIPISSLYIKDFQTYTIPIQGISYANNNQIYDDNKKSKIYIQININFYDCESSSA